MTSALGRRSRPAGTQQCDAKRQFLAAAAFGVKQVEVVGVDIDKTSGFEHFSPSKKITVIQLVAHHKKRLLSVQTKGGGGLATSFMTFGKVR